MSAYTPVCQECHERLKHMRRVFLWLPTAVYTHGYFRDGWRCWQFVWRDADGKHYTEKQP